MANGRETNEIIVIGPVDKMATKEDGSEGDEERDMSRRKRDLDGCIKRTEASRTRE